MKIMSNRERMVGIKSMFWGKREREREREYTCEFKKVVRGRN